MTHCLYCQPDLYTCGFTVDTFAVAIDPSPASRKAKLAGSCLMEVTSYDIVLWKKAERHRQTLQEILRCPIMSMVDSSCQALENQEYNHIINLQLARCVLSRFYS